ncbi:MAG: hypothetical protein AB7O97_21490 [Planctomycetota bacterium]
MHRALWSTLVAFLAACAAAPSSESGTAPAMPGDESVIWRPATTRTGSLPTAQDENPNVRSTLRPGTRIDLKIPPRARIGIPLPSGVCLPGLNGIAQSGAINRPAEHGPVLPVTAVVVDKDGYEWFEHKDGSMTTSKFVWQPQEQRWAAVTLHAIARQ